MVIVLNIFILKVLKDNALDVQMVLIVVNAMVQHVMIVGMVKIYLVLFVLK